MPDKTSLPLEPAESGLTTESLGISDVEEASVQAPHGSPGRRLVAALSPRNVSAVYVFVLLFVIFALWVPDTFLTGGVWRSLLSTQALNALVAIGVAIPLSAGMFDLAVGAEVGLAGIIVAWALSKQGLPIVPAIIVALAAGGIVGVISGLLVVRARVDSFIATLGMSSVLLALTNWVCNNEQILNLGAGFQSIATTEFLGLAIPFWFMLVVAAVVWYVLERTPAGRRVYATGGNLESARLAGVRTPYVIVLSLAACGVISASAGILQTSTIATGDPTVGPAFLLPAYAAAFLGSTQFRGGRYNIWGTVLAVYVLATGVKGLQLAGAPVWIPDLFNGVALLIAVAMAKTQRSRREFGAIRRIISRGNSRPSAAAQ